MINRWYESRQPPFTSVLMAIGVEKPHLKMYGGMWHCTMTSTCGWASNDFAVAWRDWFHNNQTSVHPGCVQTLAAYAQARPRYMGMTLDQILASKGLKPCSPSCSLSV